MLTLARLKEVRAEISTLLEDSEGLESAQTIVLTAAEFQQSRSGTREFHYGGDLYDILKTNPLPEGKIAVALLRDEHEQDILNHLGLCLQSGNHARQDHRLAGSFVKLLTQTFVLPSQIQLSAPSADRSTSLDFPFRGLYSIFHPFMIAPPPRLA